MLYVEATPRNRGIPCKILKITHNYLIYFFYHHFLMNFSSSQGTHIRYLVFSVVSRSKRWVALVKYHPLRPIQPEMGEFVSKNRITHNYLVLSVLSSIVDWFSHHSRVRRVVIWFIQIYSEVINGSIREKCWILRQLRPETGESLL